MGSSFRHHLSSLSLLVGIAVPWAAFAQVPINSVGPDSVEDRVTQLGRTSNAHSQLLTQLQQQLSDNQPDIDPLHGQIQGNQYRLSQVVEHQKQVLLQMNNLGSGSVPAAQAADGGQSGTAVIPAPDAGAAAASGAPVQTSDADTDYNTATTLVQDKSCQDDAIGALQNFIRKYPDSTYLPNANYWLDQLNCNEREEDDAAFCFASVVKNFPKSPKTVDAMYKIGVIMQGKGDKKKAKAVYQQVITKYPGTDDAKQAQKHLGAV